MLAKSELKLENGEVISLQFGMWSKAKFFELFKDLEKPTMPDKGATSDEKLRYELIQGRFAIMVAAMIICAGAENARVNSGDMRPVQLHEAMNWIDLAGGIKSEQVKDAISINDFFSDMGELTEATPPKKRKSAGGKSKTSQ